MLANVLGVLVLTGGNRYAHFESVVKPWCTHFWQQLYSQCKHGTKQIPHVMYWLLARSVL